MITVVGAPWCNWCSMVKEFLTMHDIEFIDLEPSFLELQEILAPYDVTTIPQVFIGDPRGTDPVTRIGGYEDTVTWVNSGKPM